MASCFTEPPKGGVGVGFVASPRARRRRLPVDAGFVPGSPLVTPCWRRSYPDQLPRPSYGAGVSQTDSLLGQPTPTRCEIRRVLAARPAACWLDPGSSGMVSPWRSCRSVGGFIFPLVQ